MRTDPAQIRADFDKLAHFLDDSEWTHNSHYHAFLLRQLPPRVHKALDIGCGTGLFSHLLAQRADQVVGFDLSPEMIRVAQARSAHLPNLDYQLGDVTTWDAPAEEFDCIATIATLHHLAPSAIYPKLAQALKPGGVLLVLDLYTQSRPVEYLSNILAVPLSYYHKKSKNRHLQPNPEERKAWEEHGQHDVYPTIAEVRRVCQEYLPGAKVRVHLLWRYSIVWRKSVQ